MLLNVVVLPGIFFILETNSEGFRVIDVEQGEHIEMTELEEETEETVTKNTVEDIKDGRANKEADDERYLETEDYRLEEEEEQEENGESDTISDFSVETDEEKTGL